MAVCSVGKSVLRPHASRLPWLVRNFLRISAMRGHQKIKQFLHLKCSLLPKEYIKRNLVTCCKSDAARLQAPKSQRRRAPLNATKILAAWEYCQDRKFTTICFVNVEIIYHLPVGCTGNGKFQLRSALKIRLWKCGRVEIGWLATLSAKRWNAYGNHNPPRFLGQKQGTEYSTTNTRFTATTYSFNIVSYLFLLILLSSCRDLSRHIMKRTLLVHLTLISTKRNFFFFT